MKYSEVEAGLFKMDYDGNIKFIEHKVEPTSGVKVGDTFLNGVEVIETTLLPNDRDIIMTRGWGSEKMTLTVHSDALRYLHVMFSSI